ncbi:hypothetical protein DYB28_008677, partial [Aphanomyces astaci]
KKMVTTWRKQNKDDEGSQETICSQGVSKEEFEEEWKSTPFAKAQESAKPLEGEKPKALQGEQSKASEGEQSKQQVAA